MTQDLLITPESKVAEVLEQFPQLEETLIAMAPPFKKLRNPVLRRTVAKIASLRQAAAVGGLQVDQMVNELRSLVGQEPMVSSRVEDGQDDPYYSPRPNWFDRARVVATLNESELDANVMPLKPIMQKARTLRSGEILELVSSYLPAPGIDVMRKKHFLVWATKEEGVTKTYFMKSPDR